MILALDTSTAACSAALFNASGELLARKDEVIGRGHAERLVPMVANLLGSHTPKQIIVGIGPGSFTGIRVGIAAAHGLAMGWDAGLSGMSSLALLAASAGAARPVAAAMIGGHGELFVQEFDNALEPASELLNLPPEQAAAAIDAELVIGPAAATLVEARGWGTAIEGYPAAAGALSLPERQRSHDPAPLYARAPDAQASAA